MTDLEEQKPGVSRRTVAKAMAWSVPAVALAVPAPAYAASPRCVPTISFEGCRCPGQSTDFPFTYFVRFCAVLPDGCGTGDIVVENVFANTGDNPPLVPVGFSFPVTVPADGCTDTVFQLNSTNSSVNVLVQVEGFADLVDAKMPVQQCPECEGDTPALQSTEEQAPAPEQQTAPEETAPEETAPTETPAP